MTALDELAEDSHTLCTNIAHIVLHGARGFNQRQLISVTQNRLVKYSLLYEINIEQGLLSILHMAIPFKYLLRGEASAGPTPGCASSTSLMLYYSAPNKIIMIHTIHNYKTNCK